MEHRPSGSHRAVSRGLPGSSGGFIAAAVCHLDASIPRHHDASVRTTLTLDPDVARLLAEEAHRQRKPFKQVVNDAIRRGLGGRSAPRRSAYKVKPHTTKLRAGIDKAGFNKLVDELEDDAALPKLRRRA